MCTEARHDHDRDRLGEKGDHGHLDFLAPSCGRGHTHTHMHSQAHGYTHAHTPLGHLGCLQMFKGLFVICSHEQQSGSRRPALSEPHGALAGDPRPFVLRVCSEHRDVTGVRVCGTCFVSALSCVRSHGCMSGGAGQVGVA